MKNSKLTTKGIKNPVKTPTGLSGTQMPKPTLASINKKNSKKQAEVSQMLSQQNGKIFK